MSALAPAALLCLTQAIYFEARGEPLLTQYAVAEVVMNRVSDPRYPDNVCDVLAEDRGPGPHDCQFSFMCDGKPEIMKEARARERAERIARVVSMGVTNTVGNSLFFHAEYVKPAWARKMRFVRKIGKMLFYERRK